MPKIYDQPKVYALTESAVNVTFGNDINPEIHKRVKKMIGVLDEAPFTGYVESVPSYVGVTVFFDPIKVDSRSPSEYVIAHLRGKVAAIGKVTENQAQGSVVTAPVCYAEAFAPDLSYVAELNDLTEAEVVHIHTSAEYLVHMIGFAPGFPYVGGMSERIATPRKDKPRLKIPAGSVGIAGAQTGVYPLESPGGWQIIGQTPLKMFNPHRDQPSLLKAGDTILFKAITLEEFHTYKEGDR